MSLHLSLLLLAAVGSIGALPSPQSGNSQAALDTETNPTQAKAELVPVSAENLRFSRLLKSTANALQFSSISNDAPPIWGIHRDGKKEGKVAKVTKGNSISASNFGRRALDYDEPNQGVVVEEPTSETKIVAHPYPGNEYVYVRAGKLDQQVEAATNPHHLHHDSDVSASVTTINNKPPRVPLAILRQKKGKRVNISPLFTELPPQVHQVSSDNAAGKEFVWVDQPSREHQHHRVIAVNRKGRKHEEVEEVTTNPTLQDEDAAEATTILPEDLSFESSTSKQHNSKLIVNIVTSEPRFSVESSSSEKKARYHSRRKTSTASTTTTTSEATTTSASTTTVQATTEAIPETTTFTTTTSQAPTTTTVVIPVLSSSSPKALVADEKENLVADASHRAGTSFHGFEDSQAKLQTAESSQPARVNVRPAQNGKEYEYEYIYYYYDDEDENGEKSGEHQAKAMDQTKDGKKTSPATSTTVTSSAPVAHSSSAADATTVVISSTTTSTSTLPPQLSSDADFEYDDDALEEELHHVPEIQKSTPAATRTTEAPIHKAVSSAEKLSNSNPINQLDRSRGPKIVQPGKFEEAVAEYKLETEASQEDVVQVQTVQSHAQSKGQPTRHLATTSSEEEEELEEEIDDAPPPGIHVTVREPSTVAPSPLSTLSESDIPEHMSTLAKTHKDSVNVPVILKQSNLLKAVPASHLQTQGHRQTEHHSTVSFTTPSTTTTTIEISSEAVPSRPASPRFRGNRLRGNVTPRPSTTSEQPATPVEEKPQQGIRRPHNRDPSSRRIPGRRPAPEVSTAESVPEQQPAASPIIEHHARPLPIRPRFPPRTGAGHSTVTTTVTTIVDEVVSDAPPQPVVTVSAAELNSLDDKKSKDSHIRAKSANDLFAFARLQQAISSRAPSRIQPKLVAGFVNSGEVTTDAITSSEVTTVTSFGGQSSESVGVSSDQPPTTAATTSTTTEAVQLDKYGRPRSKFGGRTRRPLGGGAGASASTTTTEAPATQRNRFTGGRRRASTTEAPEGTAQQSTSSVNNAESEKPKLPQRNRFATRHRGFSTTEAAQTNTDSQKPAESDKPVSAPVPRRRPGAGGFQGRRRPNQIQTQTEASSAATPEETPSTAGSTDTGSTAAATTTAAPAAALPGRNRFNFNSGGGRPRPGAQGPGNNPVRIRGGGRLRGPTSTTTEAAPEEQPEAPEQQDAEQSIQNENVEQAVQSSPAPESPLPPRAGVLGRLKSRPKLVVTTTIPPEGSGDRKHGRLNGLLGRRKNLGQLTSAVHIKEEVKETTSEGEEANNHALEQIDDDHKGVVVQVSSSITESEEVNEAHAGEVLEPASTTPGSILNRLKSQRKPGSLFRKKPDPHGE